MDKNRLKILIVDDSPEDQETVRRFLEKDPQCEYIILQAYTGEEGLELFKSEAVDCILLDNRLPDTDGLEFIEELSDENGRVQVPVIFLTGTGDEELAVQAMKKGATDYLVKDKLTEDLLIRTIRNAIERKRAEKVLREEQFLHQTILSNISDAVFITGDTGTLTFICPNVEFIFGYSFEEVRGLENISKLIEGDLFDRNKLETHGEIQNIEREIVDKAGNKHVLLINVKRVSIDRGTVLYSCRDITERKQLADELRRHREHLEELVEERTSELRESEQRIQNLMEAVPVGIAISTPGTERIVTELNSTVLKLFGYGSKDEFIKLPADAHYYDPKEREILSRLREAGPVRNYETRFKRKDGSVFWGSVTAVTHTTKDGEIEFINAFEDITERKQMEEQILRQNKLLEGINKVFREALTCETDAQVASVCLEVAEELTNSKFGFIGEVNPAGRFDTIVISNPGWDACKMPDSEATLLTKDMEIRGIDRSTIRDEKSRIVNDPTSHPDRVGTPQGHPPITSFLGVPLKQAGKTIGMIGLGNKESGFDLADQQALEALSVAFMEALSRVRAEMRIEHLNRLLYAIRKVNQLIVTEKDRDRLLKRACDNLIETRGYHSAWIALLDESERLVTAAEAGMSTGFLQLEEGLKRGEVPGCGRRALKQAGIVVTKDPVSMCVDCLASANCHGREAMTIRLGREDRLYGLLTVTVSAGLSELEEGQSLFQEVASDITFALHSLDLERERDRAEESLRESEEKFRSISASAQDAIIMIDDEGDISFWNDAAENIFGYSSEEALGKEYHAFLAPERYYQAYREASNKFKTTGQGPVVGKTLELEAVRKDGTEFPIELSMSVVKLKDRWNAIGILRDISERKRAEMEIKEYAKDMERMVEERTKELNRALYDSEESRDRIDSILKSIGDGLIVTDLYQRIILMNRAAEDLLDIRLSEVIDRPIDYAIKHKTLRERVKIALVEREPGYEFDFEIPSKEQRHPRIMRARTSPMVKTDDKQSGIIFIIQDVTYEKEVDRMKTDFISTAAHELRTPLTSIMGFSEILFNQNNLPAEEKREFLGYINSQAITLKGIIDDLLDISRLEAGQGFDIIPESFEIKAVTDQVVSYFKQLATKHRFEISFPKKPARIFADKEKLEQVMKNLVENAIKYSPEGGLIRVHGEIAGDYYQISVEDEGIGMTPDEVEKVFEKFYRAKRIHRKIGGTGLGMSIVKYIVEAHEGKVWVESEYGKGTTVRFTIPVGENSKFQDK